MGIFSRKPKKIEIAQDVSTQEIRPEVAYNLFGKHCERTQDIPAHRIYRPGNKKTGGDDLGENAIILLRAKGGKAFAFRGADMDSFAQTHGIEEQMRETPRVAEYKLAVLLEDPVFDGLPLNQPNQQEGIDKLALAYTTADEALKKLKKSPQQVKGKTFSAADLQEAFGLRQFNNAYNPMAADYAPADMRLRDDYHLANIMTPTPGQCDVIENMLDGSSLKEASLVIDRGDGDLSR